MARLTSQYVCQQCGATSPRWMGQCPNCNTWNSLVETAVMKHSKGGASRASSSIRKIEPVKLSDVKKIDYAGRFSTGIAELDRVLGGGIVHGLVALIAGEPGIGKSTLLLQIAENIAGQVIYVAGEESATQIANRAGRLGIKGANISVIEETDVDSIISALETGEQRLETRNSENPISKPQSLISLIIVDSIQTLTTGDLTGTAGSIGQVKECAARLTSWAKRTGVPMFIVGHVTKEGSIAGPRVLEHMVDTVLWFEGDRREFLRVLRAVKNRFGATDEVGIFAMEEKGLMEVANPSNLFLGSNEGVPGSVTTVVLEGTRPILVEIQALVAQTKLAFPKRSAAGIDQRRLELVIAVLSRRVGLPLWDYDVYVNATGGIKLTDPATDLAVALAIASAFNEKSLEKGTIAVGEVGLLGEIREVVQLDRRLKEANRLGYKKSVTARDSKYLSQAVGKLLKK